MKTAYVMTLVAGLSLSAATTANAVSLADRPMTPDQSAERPLIQLEQSLLPEGRMTLGSNADTLQSSSTHYLANALVRGLLVANRTREIGYYAALSYKLQDVVRRLRRGESLEMAGNRSRVSSDTLSRLLKLGQIRSARRLDY
jgi:hypothetical protein